MCETTIIVNGRKHTKEAAKIVVSREKITVYDILGSKKEIKNAIIEEVDFIGHKTKIRKK